MELVIVRREITGVGDFLCERFISFIDNIYILIVNLIVLLEETCIILIMFIKFFIIFLK